MKKKLLLILFCMISFNAVHAEINWDLSDDGTLTISGTDMPDYAFRDSYPWHYQRDKIKKVVIEDGVTNIGTSAFEGCTSLTSITIPESVTSIGNWAFDGTNWYNNQPDGLIYVGRFLYKYKGTMPTNTKIVVKDGIKGIANFAFNNCFGLTSIIIGNSVTSIGNGAFFNCSGLTSITLPNSVKSIGSSSFFGCSGLTSITLPNSVTNIGEAAFMYCYGLTSITIPNSVTNIEDGTFYGCSNLNSLTISNGVVCIRKNAFSGCDALNSITIPKSVTNIETNAFQGSSLQYISVESDNNVYDSRNNCNAIIRKADNTLILGCVNTIIPNNVASIGENAFSGCSSITSITIPNSVTNIGNMAFSGCSSITSVTIPKSVTSIGINPFSNCSELYSIIVESDNSVYDSRENCNSIIRKSDNALISGCINSIIPNGVTIIGDNAFCGCKDLISINIPYSVTSIGDRAFTGCSLTSVTIPDNVTSIGDYAFFNCSNLTSVTIPNKVTNIGNYAFANCASITSVTIPNSVTNIGENAFSCRSDKLKEITINVNKDLKINKGAFFHSNIEKVTMYGETLPAMVDDDPYEGAFSSACYTATLSVPSALYKEYCSTSPWNKFTKIEKNASAKYLTDAEKYTNNSQLYDLEVSYTRTFNNTAWQALYIPFSMSYSDWKDDFEIAYINGVRQLDKDDNGTVDETIMDVIKIKSGSTAPNTPYLIKAKTTGEKTLSVSNTTLYAAEEKSIDCRTTIVEYTFTGTYSTIPSATMIANKYYAMGGGNLIQSDGSNDLMPYRWYMKAESRNSSYNASNAAKTITINVIGEEEEETTGVEELRITNYELPIYDLNGRKVNENSLKPGIYVKNGKKFVVK